MILENKTSTAYYYTRDHLGSVREMCSSTGTITSRMAYDPYGRTTTVSGTILPTKQYAGMYIHQTSGLALTKYRAYDSNTGRWLSRDPLPNAERMQGPNLYEYCFNDPIRYNDPDGRVVPLIIPAALIIVGGGFEIYDRVSACNALQNGQTMYISTPMTVMTTLGSSWLNGISEGTSNGPVLWKIKVSKDNCGNCSASLVFFSLAPTGA